MTTRLGLSAMKRHTSFAPLAALGYVLHHADFFAPLREHVQLGGKTIIHEPYQKLLDVVVSVLADCASLKQINTRLRPETALAAAWGREKFADQSTITRVLDAFTPLAVAQLRTAIARIYRREGQALRHPFAHEHLFLDIDLTGLPAGRHAEASTKGYFSGEKTVMDANWPASVPPNTMKAWCPSSILEPDEPGLFTPHRGRRERLLGLPPAQRRRTVLRLDGGFGTDANLNWALWHGYQVLAQGYSGKRAKAFARAVPQWEELRPGARWIALAPMPLRYYRRTQTAVLKWKTEQDTFRHSLLITSLMEHSLPALAEVYDDRAAIEAELKADKGGLQLHRRRKQRLAAQEALVLLTDLAHNLLAWARAWLFHDSPFADAGLYRMVKELLPIPGKVVIEAGHIVKLRLKTSHPLAKPMLVCLARLFDRFGTPGILRKS